MKLSLKGKPIPKPGVPESFRVLVKELQSFGCDMRVLDEDDYEVEFVILMKVKMTMSCTSMILKSTCTTSKKAAELEKLKKASDKTE